MSTPLSAQTETNRVAALRRLHVLDTPPEECFDAIVQLAAAICRTPIALISLLDEGRQWFKARVGLDVQQTPREIAFCNYAIRGSQLCMVPDTLLDDRFAANPLVQGDPKIRFYAGMPLVTSDGFSIGTLCVIDRSARPALSAHEQQCLQLLAREAMVQLELRRALIELQRAQAALQNANDDLEAFGAAAAHDLRAPLRHMEGYAAVLTERLAGDEEGLEIVKRIRLGALQAMDVVDALLKLSRIGHGEIACSVVDLSTMTAELCRELSAAEPTRQFQFDIECGLATFADPSLIRVLLGNLLSNAAKYSRSQSVAQIQFGQCASKNGREYFIKDNGIGFDNSRGVLPAKPFKRHHEGTSHEGLGLGLTIVQRIAHRHGGNVRAESAEGQGATFFFTLGPQDTLH